MSAPFRTAALAVLGVPLTAVLSGAQPGMEWTSPAPRTAPAAAAGSPVVTGFRSPHTYPTAAPPVRLRIPALHVTSRLQRLVRYSGPT